VLNELIPGGFNHYTQSLRIVDVLENDGRGLNLTWEVRDGIAKHSKGKTGSPVGVDPDHRAHTLEGQVARIADLVAYVNHDVDDAMRAGILKQGDLPSESLRVVGSTSSERIGRMVRAVVLETLNQDLRSITMSADILTATLALREFLFAAVYENELSTAEFKKASGILCGLWEKVRERPESFVDGRTLEQEGLDVAICDFIAGMTDRYAVALFEHLFVPRPWTIGSAVDDRG